MATAFPVAFFLYVGVIGLVIGSFLNVVILRLPYSEELLPQDHEHLPSTLMGRSYCPHCGSALPWRVNVPLVAWLALKGKSACCKQTIHWRYPAIELITALTTLGLFWFFGPTLPFIVSCALSYVAICLAVIDFEHMLLPDKLTLSMLWISLVSSVFNVFQEASSAIIGAAAGYAFVFLINSTFKIVAKKDGFGGGDFKLNAAIGSILGWYSVPGVMGGAVVAFLIYAFSVGKFKKDQPMPFGPFLLIGGLIWLLLGPFY